MIRVTLCKETDAVFPLEKCKLVLIACCFSVDIHKGYQGAEIYGSDIGSLSYLVFF